MPEPMTAARIAELRRIATGEDWSPPQREDIAELLDENERLRSIHDHRFTDNRTEPVTCPCGVRLLDWLEQRKSLEKPKVTCGECGKRIEVRPDGTMYAHFRWDRERAGLIVIPWCPSGVGGP